MPVCASSLSVVTFPSDRDASANRPHQTRFRINGARVGASAWNLKLPHGSPSMLCFYIVAWSSSLFANPVSIEAESDLTPGPPLHSEPRRGRHFMPEDTQVGTRRQVKI